MGKLRNNLIFSSNSIQVFINFIHSGMRQILCGNVSLAVVCTTLLILFAIVIIMYYKCITWIKYFTTVTRLWITLDHLGRWFMNAAHYRLGFDDDKITSLFISYHKRELFTLAHEILKDYSLIWNAQLKSRWTVV